MSAILYTRKMIVNRAIINDENTIVSRAIQNGSEPQAVAASQRRGETRTSPKAAKPICGLNGVSVPIADGAGQGSTCSAPAQNG